MKVVFFSAFIIFCFAAMSAYEIDFTPSKAITITTLVGDTGTRSDVKVYPIKSIPNAAKGETTGKPGGYVEGYHNLDQSGDCWIDLNNGETTVLIETGVLGGIVCGDARVTGNAIVKGGAVVYEKAIIGGDAVVHCQARVYGRARVLERSEVTNKAKVHENAIVYGQSIIGGESDIQGYARISGKTKISLVAGMAIKGEARVYGNAKLSGRIKLLDNSRIFGDAVLKGESTKYPTKILEIPGQARVSGCAVIEGFPTISGTAVIYGPIKLGDDDEVSGASLVTGCPEGDPADCPDKPTFPSTSCS